MVAHRGQPLEHQAHDVLVTGAEHVRQVLDGDPQLVDGREDVVGVGCRAVALDEGHHRRERRDVPDHGHRPVFRMEREGDAPLHRQLPDRRAHGRLEPVLGNAVAARLRPHLGVIRVQEHVELGVEQVMLVGHGRGRLHAVGVVEDDAEVADPPDAGLRADGRHPGLDARVAEGALLGLARVPVEVDLLVRAAADAHPPAAALLLVDEDDAVLLALVHRAGGARGHAGGVEAVLADARQVHHEDRLVVGPHLLLEAVAHVRVLTHLVGTSGEVVLPVGPPLQAHPLPGHLRLGPRDRLVLLPAGGDERAVVVGPRLVVVVELRQVRVGEQRGELTQRAAGLQAQAAAAVQLPAALPLLLVLPRLRVADAGLGLDVVEPHVLRALAIRPHGLAGDRAGVAPDALVEVHHHPDLGHDAHQ